jgi:hypothetical protein
MSAFSVPITPSAINALSAQPALQEKLRAAALSRLCAAASPSGAPADVSYNAAQAALAIAGDGDAADAALEAIFVSASGAGIVAARADAIRRVLTITGVADAAAGSPAAAAATAAAAPDTATIRAAAARARAIAASLASHEAHAAAAVSAEHCTSMLAHDTPGDAFHNAFAAAQKIRAQLKERPERSREPIR